LGSGKTFAIPFLRKIEMGCHMEKLHRLLVLFAFSCTLIFFVGYSQSDEKRELLMTNKTQAKALVVVYSYTGNTKAVADEIIKRFNADFVIIEAKNYDGFTGGTTAAIDAWKEVITTDIKPETVDLSYYNLIFLGAPIWWYRQAVPLWTFVEKNDFKDKTVVLFNTFNSKFKPKYIEEFTNLVIKRGGKFHDHIYIRRGRWFFQLSRENLLEKFNKLLDTKEDLYNNIISRENNL
jgi:flavodoxin